MSIPRAHQEPNLRHSFDTPAIAPWQLAHSTRHLHLPIKHLVLGPDSLSTQYTPPQYVAALGPQPSQQKGTVNTKLGKKISSLPLRYSAFAPSPLLARHPAFPKPNPRLHIHIQISLSLSPRTSILRAHQTPKLHHSFGTETRSVDKFGKYRRGGIRISGLS